MVCVCVCSSTAGFLCVDRHNAGHWQKKKALSEPTAEAHTALSLA